MDEVGADEARFGRVPLAHGAIAAHGHKGIEERALQFRPHALLNGDHAAQGGYRADGAVGQALAAVHGAHDQDARLGQGRAHAAQRFAELSFIGGVDEFLVDAFIRAVVDDDQVGLGMLQQTGPVAFVHHFRDHRNIRAIDAQAGIDDAGCLAPQVDAEGAHGSAFDADFQIPRVGRELKGGEQLFRRAGGGAQFADGRFVREEGHGASTCLAESTQFHLLLGTLAKVEAGISAGRAIERHSTQTVAALQGPGAFGPHVGGCHLPAIGTHRNAAMLVPGPGFGDEMIAVARVAELRLE